MQLVFDRGTPLLRRNLTETACLPGILRDPRVGAWRAPACCHTELSRELARRYPDFRDEVRPQLEGAPPIVCPGLRLCFAKIPADRLLESPGLSLPSRRLSLCAKSHRTPGTEAPEPARAGRMYLQHSPGMVGTAVWEQRLCGTGIVRSQQRATGITLRASRSDGEMQRNMSYTLRFRVHSVA